MFFGGGCVWADSEYDTTERTRRTSNTPNGRKHKRPYCILHCYLRPALFASTAGARICHGARKECPSEHETGDVGFQKGQCGWKGLMDDGAWSCPGPYFFNEASF